APTNGQHTGNHTPVKPLTYSRVVEISKQSKPKSLTKPTMQAGPSKQMKPARSLRGVCATKTTTLYLENIAKDECESDDDIVLQVKDYATTKGISIHQCYVVHNKVSTLRVGCKITVPVDQIVRALKVETWPDPVVCRKWEYKRKKTSYGTFKRSLDYPAIDNDTDYDLHEDIYESTNEYYRQSVWDNDGNNRIFKHDESQW
ncbi:unnamed protein product, partial [Owenia fusiformis]